MRTTMEGKRGPLRYSISVSSKTYDRLLATVTSGSLARFVDEIVTSALDDPAILVRVVGKCRPRKAAEL